MQQGRIHINPRYQRFPNDTIVQPPLFSTSRDVLVVMVPDDRPSTSPHSPKQNKQIHKVLGRIVAPQFIAQDPLQRKTITKSRIQQLDTEGRIEDQKCLWTPNLHFFFPKCTCMIKQMILTCYHGIVKCMNIERCSCIKTFHFCPDHW